MLLYTLAGWVLWVGAGIVRQMTLAYGFRPAGLNGLGA